MIKYRMTWIVNLGLQQCDVKGIKVKLNAIVVAAHTGIHTSRSGGRLAGTVLLG